MAIGTIGAIAGLLSTGYGLYKSSQSNDSYDKDWRRILGTQRRDLTQAFEDEHNRDFLDTDVASAALNRITSNYEKQLKRGEGQMAGATEEGKIAARSKANEGYNEALSNLTGMGTQYRSNLRQQYQDRMMNLSGQELQHRGAQHAREQDTWANVLSSSSEIGNMLGDLG